MVKEQNFQGPFIFTKQSFNLNPGVKIEYTLLFLCFFLFPICFRFFFVILLKEKQILNLNTALILLLGPPLPSRKYYHFHFIEIWWNLNCYPNKTVARQKIHVLLSF